LLGTRLTDYVSDEDRPKLQKCIDTAFRFNKSSICEVSDVNGEKERWYSLSFGAVREPKRLTTTTTTTTVTIRDVTRHKRTEDVLRASREQLREFAARLDQVREEERTRVAREIHDDLGQALTIFKMDLAWLQGKTKGADVARKKIKAMIRDVDQTIERFRRIVSELRPSILDEMGLTAALEWQVAQIQQRTGIRCIFETTKEDFNLPPDTAAALFRVVQEALTNVVRHAGARQVRVTLRPAADILRIAITDDGKGLARNQVDDRKSFGIVGMRERVHRIGGEFKIFSGPGRGTRLEIAAPLK
jgi:signal transduction histidine kinase